MGIRSRRVMGLGLPLMEVLRVDQMGAVLAHEFGHYHGGDTMLGPWIQKIRRVSFGRLGAWAIAGFAFRSPSMRGFFFRITNAISRQQEFAADALAAGFS